MTDKPISPLRQRMIEDMTVRHFKEKVQKDYIRHGDCPEPGGQAANAICRCRATAGSKRCPNPEPSVPL